MFCMVLSDSPQRGHFTEVLERFQTKCEILLSGSKREIPVVLAIKCLYRKDLFFFIKYEILNLFYASLNAKIKTWERPKWG